MNATQMHNSRHFGLMKMFVSLLTRLTSYLELWLLKWYFLGIGCCFLGEKEFYVLLMHASDCFVYYIVQLK